ncbi:hypothetical protein [Paracoccus luteus]|uniref:hypothetical protein n=1 Tax=Paracoccus luteus TaxID=2508543 RepID=UPI00106FDA7A|nr:hypothetical protein [Paracoccus luteus]
MTEILRLSVPMTVWIAAFSAVYGLQGLLCAGAFGAVEPGTQRGLLILAGAVAVAVQVALLMALRAPRFASPSRFVQRVSVILAVVALISTVWTLLPVVASSVCL